MEVTFAVERAFTAAAFESGSKFLFGCVLEQPPRVAFLGHTILAFGIPLGMACVKGFLDVALSPDTAHDSLQ